MIISCRLQINYVKASLQYTEGDLGSKRSLLAELVRLALAEDVSIIRQAILRQIALIINKFMSEQDLHYTTELLYNLITGLVETTSLPENAVRIIFWISKALVLRLHNTNEVLNRLLGLLWNPIYGLASARGFSLLLSPDEILTKENGANIRLLAKQKVFTASVPSIAQTFQNADNNNNKASKPNFLIALTGILKYMPTAITMQEINTLFPLLLQSLDIDDPDVKAATIQTLTVISQESPKAVESHLGSLVTRLLKAASDRKVNSVAVVRLNALRCLRIFPGRIKDSTMLPYKGTVTGGLMGVLDDPKRNVRREAVECRAAWFNMDEPQSD